MRRTLPWLLVLALVLASLAGLLMLRPRHEADAAPIKVALAPYQDLAMIVNAQPLGLEKKYGTRIEFLTMSWEDIPPAVASAGRAADMGFGSYIEYLTKYENLNAGSSDPVLFIYPLYVFKGGAFVTFNARVPTLTVADIRDPMSEKVRSVLSGRIGAQKASVYEMMLYELATRHGVDPVDLKIIDTPLDQGFLAAERGDLDLAAAGLTQLTEAARRGGRTVFTMDSLGFGDITGFIVKKSVYDGRRRDVENVIRMWFDSVNFVYSDIDKNWETSLAYLNRTASTHYTLGEYKAALGQEYLPRSVEEAERTFLAPEGQFSARRIGSAVNAFLVSNGIVRKAAPLPSFPDLTGP